MPKVEDIFSKLNGVKYFSSLDLAELDIITYLLVMSQSLRQPLHHLLVNIYFEELMDTVLKDLPFTITNIDVISIYS